MGLKTKLTAFLISAMMVCTCFPAAALATSSIPPIDSSSMTIVSGRTYSINNQEELANLASIVNGTGGAAPQTCAGACFVLQGDISISDDFDPSGIGNWTPIGTYSNRFNACFNGQNFEISGFDVLGDFQYAGLFGYIGSDALVMNVQTAGSVGSDCPIDATAYIGGIAGASAGTLRNCSNASSVTGDSRTTQLGGLVAFNTGTITGSFNSGEITGILTVVDIGGLIGYNQGTIRNCYNTGSVSTGDSSSIGGITGWNVNSGTAQNCYNVGSITGGKYQGGIAGLNQSDTMQFCYWLNTTAPLGIGEGVNDASIISFSDADGGTLTSGLSVTGYPETHSLLTALNNWIGANSSVPGLNLWEHGPASYAYPVFDTTWRQLAGSDRFKTMQTIVGEGFSTSDTVIIATAYNYPDALAASGLAGIENAPILLTDGSSLSSETASEINRLGATEAIIVGGPGVISETVEGQIVALGCTVIRAAGIDRSATALDIYAKGAGSWNDTPGNRTAIIATGYGFADALSISPYAYASENPIFLTGGAAGNADIDDAVKAILTTVNFDRVIIVGGIGVVSSATESYLNGIFGEDNVDRLSGDDRYRTSAEIAAFAINDGVLSCGSVAVATGMNFPDALAGSTLCGSKGSVLLLVDDSESGLYCIDTTITDNEPDLLQGYFLGGDGVVSPTLQYKIRSAGK